MDFWLPCFFYRCDKNVPYGFWMSPVVQSVLSKDIIRFCLHYQTIPINSSTITKRVVRGVCVLLNTFTWTLFFSEICLYLIPKIMLLIMQPLSKCNLFIENWNTTVYIFYLFIESWNTTVYITYLFIESWNTTVYITYLFIESWNTTVYITYLFIESWNTTVYISYLFIESWNKTVYISYLFIESWSPTVYISYLFIESWNTTV